MKASATALLSKGLRAVALLRRPMTLGVRVAAFDTTGRIFLVRHAWRPGWYLPGGGVDPGETAEAAARREAQEEGRLTLGPALALVAISYNRLQGRDHVVLYRSDDAVQTAPRPADREIAEAAFFPLHALPEGVTPATVRRLAELGGERPIAADW